MSDSKNYGLWKAGQEWVATQVITREAEIPIVRCTKWVSPTSNDWDPNILMSINPY